MTYIPPVDSYLTRYSLTSLDQSPVSLSYTLQELNTDQGLLVNGNMCSDRLMVSLALIVGRTVLSQWCVGGELLDT